MKMKDVIARTDLTDRAIRLYIENGLVAPHFTESYNGRKNIDFTEEDLNTLKNIATLRKADFSIAEIKSLTENPVNCKTVLEDFLKNKNEKIENNTKIVEALSPLLSTENPDINSICEKLNAVTTDKAVPEEDAKAPLIEKIERIFFLSVSYVSILYTIVYAWINLYMYTTKYNFKYPYGNGLAFLIAMPTILLLCSLYYFLRYRKKLRKKSKTKSFTRQLTSLLLVVPLGYLAFFMVVITMFPTLFNESLIYSQTTNPSHYLDVDSHIELPGNFFPDEIPEYAGKDKYMWFFKKYPRDTQYFYRIELNVDVFAQWYIPDRTPPKWMKVENPLEDEFYAEIKRMKNYETESGNPPIEKIKCNWTLLYYADTSEYDFSKHYKYLIFAYNEDERLVRYIYSAASGGNPGGIFSVPYYLTLDWYS